jgi:hypothetical protein
VSVAQLKISPRPYADAVPAPEPGTAVPMANGTATLVPNDWLYEINRQGLPPGGLTMFLERLAEIDVANAETVAAMEAALYGDTVKIGDAKGLMAWLDEYEDD